MKKIIKLTESDLTRIVKHVINEVGYGSLIDPSQFEFYRNNNKPFHDLLTTEFNFEYLKNNYGMETYILKIDNRHIIVGVEPSYDYNKIVLIIYIITKDGKKINYLEKVSGKSGLKLSVNDDRKISRLIKGAIEFGEI